MIAIPFNPTMIAVTCLWTLVRAFFWIRAKQICFRREAQLLLVYICIMVIARCTFFPFSKVDGQVQPLLFDAAQIIPFRINLIPFVNLMDYPEFREAMINVIGNTTMFIPLGIVWPAVFRQLNKPWKVIAAGVGVSLTIEILQLPFYGRATDIDDLILNSAGFLVGYGIYLLVRAIASAVRKRRQLT